MKSLYEKKPENWDKIAKFGYPEFRELAKRFSRNCDFDAALGGGMTKVSSHWANGTHMPSYKSVIEARKLLAKIGGQPLEKDMTLFDREKEQVAKPKTEPAPEPKTDPLLVIAGPQSALKKLESIAKMLGCEVVEV